MVVYITATQYNNYTDHTNKSIQPYKNCEHKKNPKHDFND